MPSHTIGIDEVGRGALAGAVYLGACRLPSHYPRFTYAHDPSRWTREHEPFRFVRDSKKLTPSRRRQAVELTAEYTLEHAFYTASSSAIDTYGIGTCLSHLVYFLVNALGTGEILVDGQIKILPAYNPRLVELLRRENNFPTPLLRYPTLSTPRANEILVRREPKADDKYLAIALASNLAKVARDEEMTRLHAEFPEYGWAQNKGYGTRVHRQAIRNNPENPHLRRTFLGNIKAVSARDTA